MSLPRIFIEVTDGPDGTWTVAARRAADDSPVLAPYDMDRVAVETEAGARTLRVPAVPAARRQQHTPHVDALCAGDEDAITSLLGRFARGRAKDGDALAYGRWLFECLLAPAWPALTGDPGVAAARGMELALTWDADLADLHSVVWEAMFDRQDRPLAGLRDTLVVITRVVRAGYPEPETIRRAPRVLFASGASLTDEVPPAVDDVPPGFLGCAQDMMDGGANAVIIVPPLPDDVAREVQAYLSKLVPGRARPLSPTGVLRAYAHVKQLVAQASPAGSASHHPILDVLLFLRPTAGGAPFQTSERST